MTYAGEQPRVTDPHRVQAPKPEPEQTAPSAGEGRGSVDKVVFGTAAALGVGLILWGLLAPENLSVVSTAALDWLVADMGWLFIAASSAFVVFSLFLAFSRYGKIPLGRDGEKPEFRTVSWIAMMFSAGMGIGLMFYGVAEPLAHLVSPPPGTDGSVGSAMATTMFHWGLHPWAIYAVVGLSIAYGSYRRGRKQLISAAFYPLLGRRSEGAAGKVIDVLAIIATMFGTAASLGLGALQIGSGLEIIGWMGHVGTFALVALVGLLTFAFVGSAVSGVARGIHWLSNINMVLAVALALFVFVLGPTVLILNLLPTAIADYAAQLATMSGRTAASAGDDTASWLSSWTIFYWAWWVSWTPFVGMFLARISRGRTIRQFVVGVIVIPTSVSLVWFAVFGGAAVGQQQDGIDLASKSSTEGQLFGMLDHLPWTGFATVLVMVLVAIFFVSGADAASLVMGTLSQRGAREPRTWVVIFWGTLTGGTAALILWTGGSDALQGLQTMTIIAAAPFLLVMIGLCFSLYRDVSRDPLVVGPSKKSAHERVSDTV
ncbi:MULTISPECIES: BCCT family transporter [unclassified Rhodococcus (in: high G+C Gram-positive bacteria)]|uniref:BCCT family transporter n=1 Tax=unclassified Rhodococcus (in: high G+C Gram-positive bacteria) TaxID=192944 RepID=UPI00163A6A1A|nr:MULTISPECIES: BCCT family transporter [unclassified Rhodococcus (in: high G+C Gram-positive bacteria)]MBC2639192.1 BCCT family transporter [Rhodococcus sp. 3A]MBC2896064.1 BCCT family transporter [Rhodococcus sp. 4CII]